MYLYNYIAYIILMMIKYFQSMAGLAIHFMCSSANQIPWQEITWHCIVHVTYNKRIDMLNRNTPGVQKSEAKSEAPISSSSYVWLKSVISDGGQGLGYLLKYHIAINVYHLLPLLS